MSIQRLCFRRQARIDHWPSSGTNLVHASKQYTPCLSLLQIAHIALFSVFPSDIALSFPCQFSPLRFSNSHSRSKQTWTIGRLLRIDGRTRRSHGHLPVARPPFAVILPMTVIRRDRRESYLAWNVSTLSSPVTSSSLSLPTGFDKSCTWNLPPLTPLWTNTRGRGMR
jgi:hypothetical protein